MITTTKQKVFCVESVNNGTIEVSTSFRGAMIYARKHGYYNVGVRFVNSGHYYHLASLKGKKWIKSVYGVDRNYIE